MDWVNKHHWPQNELQALALQDERAALVDLTDNTGEPKLIAAAEAAYGNNGQSIYAAALVFTFPGFEEVDKCLYQQPARFPYIPGLFYFREGPALVGALSGLKCDPDLLMISGHGIAHPQFCGMACHIGIDFDKPTVGCARRLLCGYHQPVESSRGSARPISYGNIEVGVAYRSKDNVKPIFISPGHCCNVTFARNITIRCLLDYRLPEPLHQTHLLAHKHKRYLEKEISNRTSSDDNQTV